MGDSVARRLRDGRWRATDTDARPGYQPASGDRQRAQDFVDVTTGDKRRIDKAGEYPCRTDDTRHGDTASDGKRQRGYGIQPRHGGVADYDGWNVDR